MSCGLAGPGRPAGLHACAGREDQRQHGRHGAHVGYGFTTGCLGLLRLLRHWRRARRLLLLLLHGCSTGRGSANYQIKVYFCKPV